MRVLVFYQYFTTPQGAWSTRVYEMGRRWVEAGDKVTVVTSVYDKSDLRPTRLVQRFDVDGMEVIVLNVRISNKDGVLKRIYTFAMYALLASWYAVRTPADVVVASSGPPTVGIPGLIARYLGRRPFVFEIRDLWPDSPVQLGLLTKGWMVRLARWWERTCYRAASHVIACSPGQASGVTAIEPGVPVTVVSNAADLNLMEEVQPVSTLPDWARGPYVVYAGTMGRANDCRQLIRMAEVLQNRGRGDIQVVLIGDGAERAELERESVARGLSNVRFLGLRPKREVVTWLHHASASILCLRAIPVFDTVSPNKLFDSFAVGAPVIQSTQGWIKDLFAREECGITAAQNDAESLADAVCRLVDDPHERARMAMQARRVAETRFSRDLLAARMRAVLAEVAGIARAESAESACAA
jgi:glycosyltransferase involved in cell wall biosynthesis